MVKERGFQIDQERRNSNPQKSIYYADFFSIQKIEYLKISPPRGLANAKGYLTGPHTDVVTWVEVRQRASHFISFSLTTLHDVGLSDALALISVFF